MDLCPPTLRHCPDGARWQAETEAGCVTVRQTQTRVHPAQDNIGSFFLALSLWRKKMLVRHEKSSQLCSESTGRHVGRGRVVLPGPIFGPVPLWIERALRPSDYSEVIEVVNDASRSDQE